MQYPEGSVTMWFGRSSAKDPELLQEWRQSPLTYAPHIQTDLDWNADRYESLLGNDATGELFERAARLTLNNQFYPPEVMVVSSDFSLENRPVKVGDRVLQRIRIFQIAGKPVLDVLTMNEVTELILENRRAGFTYTTTQTHNEIGEWSPVVEWRDNGDVVLVINVLSRRRPGASPFARRFTRKMQLRADKLSIANFLKQLNPPRYQFAAPRFSAELLPVGLIAAAAVLLLLALLSTNRRSNLSSRESSGPDNHQLRIALFH